MAEKILSAPQCNAAKPTNKLYYLNDGAGLRLRIRPDGSRSWIYRYRLNGKEKSIGLGPYPTVSLTIAREKAAENCSLVKTGSNPQLVRRLKRVNDAVKEGQTFSTVAKEWLEHNTQEWSRNYFIRNEGLLRRFLLPDLG